MPHSPTQRFTSLRLPAAAALLLAAVLLAPAAGAHPHIWVDATTTVLFRDGAVVGARNEWRFDAMFSSVLIQDFDRDGSGRFEAAEIEALRQEAFSNLEGYDWFTHFRVGGEAVAAAGAEDFSARIQDGRVAYTFTAALPESVQPARTRLEVSVHDPSYYVDFTLAGEAPVRFAGGGGGCSHALVEDDDRAVSYDDPDQQVYNAYFTPTYVRLRCAAG